VIVWEAINFYQLLWDACWAFAAWSVATMIVLFVRRLIIQGIDRRRESRRATLQDLVFRYLEQVEGGEDPIPRDLSPRDQRLLLSVTTEMMRGVTGTMRDNLIRLLNTHLDHQRLLRGFERAPAQERAKLAGRLSWSDAPEVHASLYKALDDPSPEVVLAAVNALIVAQQPINLLALVPKLEVRDMLGHRGIRDIFRKVAPQNGAILFSLIDDPNPAIAVLAIDTMARTPSPAAMRRLRGMAQTHPSVDVRATALRTLGLASDPEAGGVITAALSDPAWEVRAQAAIAAGRTRSAMALATLTELMRDSNWWVQLRAAQALAKLGDAGLAVLERLLDDKDLGPLADFALSERHAA
jgi:hypothetical protein